MPFNKAQLELLTTNNVYTNTSQDITGDKLQQVLLAIIDSTLNSVDDTGDFIPYSGTDHDISGDLAFANLVAIKGNSTKLTISDVGDFSIFKDYSTINTPAVISGDVSVVPMPGGVGNAAKILGGTGKINFGNRFSVSGSGIAFTVNLYFDETNTVFLEKGELGSRELIISAEAGVMFIRFGEVSPGEYSLAIAPPGVSIAPDTFYSFKIVIDITNNCVGVFDNTTGDRLGKVSGLTSLGSYFGDGNFYLTTNNQTTYYQHFFVENTPPFNPDTTLSYIPSSQPYENSPNTSGNFRLDDLIASRRISSRLWAGYSSDLTILGGLDFVHDNYLQRALAVQQSSINNKQPLDATLTALSGYNTNGFLVQTAPDTFTGRTIVGTTNRLTVTNGDGVSGNPILDISSSYAGQSSITTLGTIATGVWHGSTIDDAYLTIPYIKADGSRALTADWNAGAFNITANSFVASGTGANKIPVGTSVQQPSATDGLIRYNTTTARFEFGQTGPLWFNHVRLQGDTMLGPLILNADASTALGAVTLQQLNAAVAGLYDLRGGYNASSNLFPSTGGSGTAGAILKADVYIITASGTLGGTPVTSGDQVTALVDSPGQTASNWSILSHDLGYTPISNVLNSGQILVGNASNIAAAVSMSGDVTISNAGVTTIGNSKVTNAMLAGNIDLTSKVTGILPVANGGTGVSTFGGTNRLLYTSVTDTLSSITTANNGILITSSGGAPSISSTLPNAVQDNIVRLGSVASGTLANGIKILLGSDATGDIYYNGGSGTLTRLAIGGSGTVLHGGAIPSYSAVSLTADVSGILPVANGGSGTNTAFTLGSILFAGGSGIYSQDNANFFWDNTNKRLGIGTNAPSAALEIVGGSIQLANNVTFNFKTADGQPIQVPYFNTSDQVTFGRVPGTSTGVTSYIFRRLANVDTLTIGANTQLNSGLFGVGIAPTKGSVEIKAGTTTVAPLVLTSGTNNTTAQAGAFEYNGTDLFFTKTGTTRGTFYIATPRSHSSVSLAINTARTPSATHDVQVVITFNLNGGSGNTTIGIVQVDNSGGGTFTTIATTSQNFGALLGLSSTQQQCITFICPMGSQYKWNNTGTSGGTTTVTSIYELIL